VGRIKEICCYIEEYEGVPGVPASLGVRLREKVSGRKVEMNGTAADGEALLQFLTAPRTLGTAAVMLNLYEQNGLDDVVVVSGEVEVDTPELIRFTYNDALGYGFA